MKSISSIFTGQCLITKQLPLKTNPECRKLLQWFQDSDVAFTNLEVSLSSPRETWPTKEKAIRVDSQVLDTLKEVGFNLLSLCNNHAWDGGPSGILNAIDEAKKRGFKHAGTGANLEEANQPAILETPNGKIALIAAASGGMPDVAHATTKEKRNPHPGVNPLKLQKNVILPSDVVTLLEQLQDSAKAKFKFLGTLKKGAHPELQKILDPEDRDRILRTIQSVSKEVDLCLVYLHQHQWEPQWEQVGSWLQAFAHDCIDHGAHCFMGHGVPLLHPIEIYRERPILYSLGNFIFHSSRTRWPEDICWESVVVKGTFKNGNWCSLKLHPIEIGSPDKLLPLVSYPYPASIEKSDQILKRLSHISEPFGTRIAINDGCGEIQFNGDSPDLKPERNKKFLDA
jgi:poly-gamma-glutamate capsule biosynthesis protein CapA/YwtB (metallophosphatase superfamily)